MSNLELLGVTDVARMAQVSRNTVLNHARMGKLAIIGRVGGKRIAVFTRAEAERYAAAMREGAAA